MNRESRINKGKIRLKLCQGDPITTICTQVIKSLTLVTPVISCIHYKLVSKATWERFDGHEYYRDCFSGRTKVFLVPRSQGKVKQGQYFMIYVWETVKHLPLKKT